MQKLSFVERIKSNQIHLIVEMIQSFKINSLNFKFLKCLKFKIFKIKFSLIGLRSSSIRIQFSRALNFLNLRLKFLNLHPINTKIHFKFFFHFKNFSNMDSKVEYGIFFEIDHFIELVHFLILNAIIATV